MNSSDTKFNRYQIDGLVMCMCVCVKEWWFLRSKEEEKKRKHLKGYACKVKTSSTISREFGNVCICAYGTMDMWFSNSKHKPTREKITNEYFMNTSPNIECIMIEKWMNMIGNAIKNSINSQVTRAGQKIESEKNTPNARNIQYEPLD